MNAAQLFRQIKTLLEAAVWPDGSGATVFPSNSVVITAGPEEKAFRLLRKPSVLLKPGTATPDPDGEEGGLQVQQVEMVLTVSVPGDALGEAALIGAGKQNIGDSRGRGLLEVEPELLRTVKILGPQNGINLSNFYAGGTSAELLPDGYSTQRGYRFDADIAGAEYGYPGSEILTATVAGANVTLTWENPGARYDFVEMVVVRKSGATAPANVTDGTEIFRGAGETKVDVPGSATWSYSVFAGYNFGDDVVPVSDVYSDPRTQTSVVVP